MGPFDLSFIDADKEHLAEYFEWALKLSRVGSLIVTDNVVRRGAVIDPAHTEPRVTATALQTVGSKGYDGFSLARVTS